MNKPNEFKDYDYSYLRRLPIDKLLELLENAPALSDEPEDEAYLNALEEAIIEKENENPTGFFPNVDQQWEQFVTQYMPEISETAHGFEPTKHAVSAQTNHQPNEAPQKRVVQFSRMWRTALVAATAVVSIVAIMVTAQAAGIDVFGAMARWTKDVFSFGTIPPDSEVTESLDGEIKIPGSEDEFSSLQDALDACGITAVHEPSYLPEGYALEELDVTNEKNPSFVAFSAVYVNGNSGIGVNLKSYEGEPSMLIEKSDATVEIVNQYGITFYLVTNVSSYIIAWHDNQYEYYINGGLSKEILLKTAISMYD